ncbi:thiolase-like protein [Chytridium lagenaria]|nr:thiolase-like protein [Chytridium lagenaria]
MVSTASKGRKVYVVGVGMTHFDKPGRRQDVDYPDYAMEAATKALLDANVTYDAVEFAAVGYCFGDSTCVIDDFMYPKFVSNSTIDCSTGSSALYLARNAVAGGQAECALALGFEKMAPGSLSTTWNDRTNPMDKSVEQMIELRGFDAAPFAPQIFANAGIEYMEKYGGNTDAFDIIAAKSHNHSTLNPYAQFTQPSSVEQVKKARKIFGPLTLLHCSPTSDGSGCAILASEEFVIKHGLGPQAIEIAAQSLATDSILAHDPNDEKKSCIEVAGSDMTRRAANDAYKATGISPKDVSVVELHDCFSANEMITYDALGLCEPGKAADFTASGATHLPQFWSGPQPTRRVVVNPSGGLISKGHPLGATGLAQCCAVVITLYKKPEGLPAPGKWQDPRERFGYNPATECRDIREEDFKKVMSRKGSLAGTPSKLKPDWQEKFDKKASTGGAQPKL